MFTRVPWIFVWRQRSVKPALTPYLLQTAQRPTVGPSFSDPEWRLAGSPLRQATWTRCYPHGGDPLRAFGPKLRRGHNSCGGAEAGYTQSNTDDEHTRKINASAMIRRLSLQKLVLRKTLVQLIQTGNSALLPRWTETEACWFQKANPSFLPPTSYQAIVGL